MPEHQGKFMTISVIVVLILNVIALLGVGFGAVSWIMSVNNSLQQTALTVQKLTDQMQAMQEWKVKVNERHAIEDDRCKNQKTGG